MLIKLITILHLTALVIDPFMGSMAVTVYVTYVGLLYQYLSEIPNPSLIFWCQQVAVKSLDIKTLRVKEKRFRVREIYLFLNSNVVE